MNKISYIQQFETQTVLKIYVQPAASKNEIVGIYGEPPRLKIKIKAPPQDGAANLEVISIVAKMLGIPKSKVELIRGETSRNKDLLIDLNCERVQALLYNPKKS